MTAAGFLLTVSVTPATIDTNLVTIDTNLATIDTNPVTDTAQAITTGSNNETPISTRKAATNQQLTYFYHFL